MLKLFVCLLHMLYFDSVESAAYILPEQPKPPKFACVEGCYQPDRDIVLPYNEKFSPQDGKTCMQYTCNADNTTQVFTCGVIGFPDYCTRVPGNKFLPYPKCCDGVSCPPEPPTTTAAPEDQNLPPNEKGTTPAQLNNLSDLGPPHTEPSENSITKSTDPDDSTDIPISPPKCPTCPNVPIPTISEFDYLPNSPSQTLPVEPPETQPIDPTIVKPIVIGSNNDTNNSQPNPSNPPLNHGPVFHLPVENPGGESRVAEPNNKDPASTNQVKQSIDPRCTFPPPNPEGSALQDTTGPSKVPPPPHCPPWAGLPEFTDSTSDINSENPSLYKQPLRTLPVQPPVDS